MAAKRKRTKVSILLEDLGWPKSEVQWAVALERQAAADAHESLVEGIQDPVDLREARVLLDLMRGPLLFMQGHLTELGFRQTAMKLAATLSRSPAMDIDLADTTYWIDRFFESPAQLLNKISPFQHPAHRIHGVVDQMPADSMVAGLRDLRRTDAARWAKLRELANSGEPENAVAAVRLSRALGL